MRLNGIDMVDTERYRVSMNSFLAAGGDNFTVFNEGTDALGGEQDIDAMESYIRANGPLRAPATDRIANLTPRTR